MTNRQKTCKVEDTKEGSLTQVCLRLSFSHPLARLLLVLNMQIVFMSLVYTASMYVNLLNTFQMHLCLHVRVTLYTPACALFIGTCAFLCVTIVMRIFSNIHVCM